MPAGTYDLVATRGPEYRTFHQKAEVPAGQASAARVMLERYADLPAGAWHSGDSHVHLMREQPADLNVWGQMVAEDVHLANLLEMGNIEGTYFKQPEWDQAGQFAKGGICAGTGPGRSAHGHARSHDSLEPQTARSISRGKAFFSITACSSGRGGQGALPGYAHLGDAFNGRRGLALDVPFGLVDFIEASKADA